MKRALQNIFVLILIGTLVFSFSGCDDDFFNEQAGDRITPEQHYQNLTDAFISLQGAIIPLQDAMPNLILLDGLRSDMMDVTENATSDLININNHNFSGDNPYTDPSDLYKVIINVNEVLANIDSLKTRDREYDEIIEHAVKGALIGLRSWTYLTIARLYGEVALIEDNLTALPENLNQNVVSKQEIISSLITQLTPYIIDNSQGQQIVEIRIDHFMNNKALLGELYLEAGQYAEAANYLKLACESYANSREMLKVDKSYQDLAWGDIFLNAESNYLENISVIPYSRAEDQYNPLPRWMGKDYEYMVKPTIAVIDSFAAQIDLAGMKGDLYRGNYTIGGVDVTLDTFNVQDAYIGKYEIDKSDPFSSDIVISRAADIHLMLAEAYNRMEDEESQNNALMLLNQGANNENPKPAGFSRWSGNLGIRGRAYLASREVPDRDSIPLNDRTLMIEDLIIAERAMELAFEGKRWSDLVRVAERRNDPAYLAEKVAAKFAGTGRQEEIRTKLMNPENWYLQLK